MSSYTPPNKALPLGLWTFIPELPDGTTEESLSRYFWKFGIQLAENCIDIKTRAESGELYALVSFRDDVFTRLLTERMGEETLDGVKLRPRPARSKSKRAKIGAIQAKHQPETSKAWPPAVTVRYER